jgi:hypothetical protein
MSMFGGFGRPQPSSAEKIAAAEAEMDLVTDMFNKYDLQPSLPTLKSFQFTDLVFEDSNKHA